MTDHDPLCPSSGLDAGFTVCICRELRAARADERDKTMQRADIRAAISMAQKVARADERERIARAIEDSYTSDYSHPAIRAYEDAARIARGEPR